MLRFKASTFPKFQSFTIFFLVIGLIISTVQGLRWFIGLTSQNEEQKKQFELKTSYYVDAIVLLGVPIVIAAFFLIILLIFICILLFEYRRNRLRYGSRGDRFEDEEHAYAEEVAETYMRLLEPVQYDKNICKYYDCSICLKEFEENEQLQRIPNCSHIFHEACLRKWFV